MVKVFLKKYKYLILFAVFLFVIVSLVKFEAKKDKENFIEEFELGPYASMSEQKFQSQPIPPPQISSVKIPIFIYHSVRPHYLHEPHLQDLYDIDPILFEKQLKYLKDNGYTTITLDTFMEYVKKGIPVGVKPVVLTFDDGWENQYIYGFPLLKKYNMIGVFYIYTHPIDINRKHFLTWGEIKEMDANGMMIASHTIYHSLFSKMKLSEIKQELIQSKKILEEKLGKPIDHFASPFGSTSNEIQVLIKEAGYKTGRTTYRGVFHTSEDFYKLRGIINTDDFNDFVNVLNSNAKD